MDRAVSNWTNIGPVCPGGWACEHGSCWTISNARLYQ